MVNPTFLLCLCYYRLFSFPPLCYSSGFSYPSLTPLLYLAPPTYSFFSFFPANIRLSLPFDFHFPSHLTFPLPSLSSVYSISLYYLSSLFIYFFTSLSTSISVLPDLHVPLLFPLTALLPLLPLECVVNASSFTPSSSYSFPCLALPFT